jgi:hypothetical protein
MRLTQGGLVNLLTSLEKEYLIDNPKSRIRRISTTIYYDRDAMNGLDLNIDMIKQEFYLVYKKHGVYSRTDNLNILELLHELKPYMKKAE